MASATPSALDTAAACSPVNKKTKVTLDAVDAVAAHAAPPADMACALAPNTCACCRSTSCTAAAARDWRRDVEAMIEAVADAPAARELADVLNKLSAAATAREDAFDAAEKAAALAYDGDDAVECVECSATFRKGELGWDTKHGHRCKCENWVCLDCASECVSCSRYMCCDCEKAACEHCCEDCSKQCGELNGVDYGGCKGWYCEECLNVTTCRNGEGCNRRAEDVPYCEECLDHWCK